MELDSEDEENDKYRYDLARSLASRKIDNIYDMADVCAQLDCKKNKPSFDDSITTMSKDCCIAFTQQEEYKVYIQLSTLKLQCIFHVNILTCLYICFDNCCSSSSSISSRLISIVIVLKVMKKPI